VKVRMLPSAVAGGDLEFLTTFVIDDTVAVDAGALGFWGDLAGQRRVEHVFVSHSHADHVCSLPVFVTNTLDGRAANVVVHAHSPVLDSLSRDVFNGRLWPDFLRARGGQPPLLDVQETAGGRASRVNGLSITPIPVDHPVPTMAHVVDDGTAAIVISTDSGPTSELWRVASEIPRLRAVFLGASFPDEEAGLARVAGHLTPIDVDRELAKIPAGVAVFAVHIKPGHRDAVIAELRALGRPNLAIGQGGRDYTF
jgi:cAMP phosphodiesterase